MEHTKNGLIRFIIFAFVGFKIFLPVYPSQLDRQNQGLFSFILISKEYFEVDIAYSNPQLVTASPVIQTQ